MEHPECSQSQYFNIETDHDDSEAAVEFLAEVRVPCLICGVDVEINNIIKREIDESEDWAENIEERHLSERSEINDKDVFDGFLKVFGVAIKKKGNQRSIDRGWDGEGGDILRFCGSCKIELNGILEFQKNLDKLQIKFKNGLEAVTKKMETFEDTFESNDIYEKDHRYKMVRSQIVKCVAENSTDCPQENLQSSLEQEESHDMAEHGSRRKSSRIKTNVPSSELNRKCVRKNNVNVSKGKDSRVRLTSDADQPPLPNLSDENPQISSGILATCQKASKNKKQIFNKQVCENLSFNKLSISLTKNESIKQIFRKKAKDHKPAKIPKKTVQEKFRCRKSARIAKNTGEKNGSLNPVQKSKNLMKTSIQKKSLRSSRSSAKLASAGGHISSQDNNVIIKKSRSDLFRKWNYKLDPSKNQITFGGIKFSISGDLQQNVSCTLCNVILRNDKKVIRRHIIKGHTNFYTCSQCSFKGEFQKALKDHIETVHSGRSLGKKFPCKICGKPETAGLAHEWTHMSKEEQKEFRRKRPELLPVTKRQNWKCEKCGKKFLHNYNLKRHKERYHGAKDILMETCPECGKAVRNLNDHMRCQHGGTKPFECTEENCGKRFIYLSGLNLHKNLVHRKLMPWKCTKCTRKFPSNYRLIEHMNLHMGIRPWKCEVEECGATFARKCLLKKHHRSFHEEGSKPKRKSYQRRSIMLGEELRKDTLVKKGV